MQTNFIKGVALSPQPTKFAPVLYAGRLLEGLRSVSSIGFKYVELSLRSIHDVNPTELNKVLFDLDLKISAIATGQACLFDQLCLGNEDIARRKKAIEHFKEMVLFSKKINSGAIIIGGIRGRINGSGNQYESNLRNGIEAIKDCAKFAEDQNILLLIEPINRYETNWILTAKDGCDLLDQIHISSVKLLLDTFHMNIEELNMVNAIKKTGNRLGYVHFADNNRHAPGQGQTNFKEILKALKSINYCGPIIAEILPYPDDETAIRETLEFWEKINNELGKE